jgi:hypothetical protein
MIIRSLHIVTVFKFAFWGNSEHPGTLSNWLYPIEKNGSSFPGLIGRAFPCA